MTAFIREPVEERFWRKVYIPSEDQCWSWTAHKNSNGYGRFTPSKERGPILAHRFSYEMKFGSIPIGKIVRHTCDNPACVNPCHLVVGSMRDNTRDMMTRNRHRSFRISACPNGHEYTPQNTYVYGARRQCKRCALDRAAAQRAAAKKRGDQ